MKVQEAEKNEETTNLMPSNVQQGEKDSVGRLADFAVRTVFTSDYYIGTEKLHVGVPLPKDYPVWYPSALKLPSLVYTAADKLVETGLIKKGAEGSTYAIRYGLLREEISGNIQCDSCEAEKRQQNLQNAAAELVNIDYDERQRRLAVGYAALPVSAALSVLAILNDVGPAGRFAAIFIGILGAGYIESGKTGL
jgi:hypothetical protein